MDCAHQAVERCEVTGAPLCAEHLWYAEDGRRVSERVARYLAGQGVRVVSSREYLERLGKSAPLPRLPAPTLQPRITRQPSYSDGLPIAAALCGSLSAASCAIFSSLPLCLPVPILAVVLGTGSVVLAPKASALHRARLLGWMGIVGGMLGLAVFFAAVVSQRGWGGGVP
ncbi:MAG: hypothetical protein NZ693_03530 [Thermoflexales bacterium]|nr:hypothetical protein [Thermoflexales bacterium]